MKKISAIFTFIFIMLISLQGRAEIITQETAKETADSEEFRYTQPRIAILYT